MKKIAILDISMCAAAIALHIVLELFCTIRIGDELKITLAALPFMIIAFLCGPAEGFLSGLIGTFLSQLITYGITATTIFWILPYAVQGLIAGILFKIFKKKISLVSIGSSICISGLFSLILNFFASYMDGVVIYKYMMPSVLIGLIPVRVIIWMSISAIYTMICIPLSNAVIKSCPAVLKKNTSRAATK